MTGINSKLREALSDLVADCYASGHSDMLSMKEAQAALKCYRQIGTTTLSDTWKNIVTLNDDLFPGWRQNPIIYWTNAFAGEVGELCNDAKHIMGGGTHKVDVKKKKLIKEMSDSFIYLVLLAESQGISVDEFTKAVESKNRLNVRRMRKRKG